MDKDKILKNVSKMNRESVSRGGKSALLVVK